MTRQITLVLCCLEDSGVKELSASDEVAGDVQNAIKSYFLQTEREYSGHMNEEQWLSFIRVTLSMGITELAAADFFESMDGKSKKYLGADGN